MDRISDATSFLRQIFLASVCKTVLPLNNSDEKQVLFILNIYLKYPLVENVLSMDHQSKLFTVWVRSA